MDLRQFWQCLTGPNVYRKYGGVYNATWLEDHCTRMINFLRNFRCKIVTGMVIWRVLLACGYAVMGISPVRAKLIIYVIIPFIFIYIGRAMGRMDNEHYLAFLRVLNAANESENEQTMQNLRQYDFDFSHWPVNYKWTWKDESGRSVKPRISVAADNEDNENENDDWTTKVTMWVLATTLGLRLAYPGTISWYQLWRSSVVDWGRKMLVERMNGKRFKLETRSGNYIDCMFVDRRKQANTPNGRTLIITCEGNAGFYEFASNAGLKDGYSVLMWNHPGFLGSGGRPWPCEEEAAIDVVVQFALLRLGWRERDVVLYGWSIGGFTATWAAMTYPQIAGLILDATFNDALPLALSHWPWNCVSLVSRVVRKYLNLEIGKQLALYNGPVLVIRRRLDEIMSVVRWTSKGGTRVYNQTNDVLKGLLVRRFPNVFDEDIDWFIDLWLARNETGRAEIHRAYGVDNDQWSAELEMYANGQFPVMIGEGYHVEKRLQLVLFLLSKYLTDVQSNHGSPLPVEKFVIPSHPWE